MSVARSEQKQPATRGLGSVIETLLTSVVLLDEHWYVIDLNASAENLLGISRSHACGRLFLTLAEDSAELAHILGRASATGEPFTTEIRFAPGRDHRYERVVDCRVSQSPPHIGTGLILELADVSRRVRMNEDRARLAQHEAGRQMMRQFAHEVRNPLGGLRGAAQLLGRELSDSHLKEYTDVIIGEADRLKALMDTLLIPGGLSQRDEVNLHELTEHVARVIEAEFPAIEVSSVYDPGLPALALDRDQIVQVLLNLYRNGAQAIGGTGTLIVRTSVLNNISIGASEYRYVANIEVEDHGPGVPPELKDSLFYPLVSASQTGSGLGLTIAQESIGRHGGLIQFSSEPGRTVFSIRIPLVKANG